MQLDTEAIVLRSTKYGDSDLILNIYSHKFGKIGVYAKNARRLKSPLMSSSQIFAYSNMTLSTRDGRYRLVKADLINNNYKITGEFESLNLAYYYIQFVEKTGLESETNVKLFNLLNEALRYLQENKNYFLQKIAFDMKIIEIFGYKPVVGQCIHCGKKEKLGNHLDVSSGGRICDQCLEPNFYNDYMKLDSTSFKLMDFMQKNSFDSIINLNVNPLIIKEISRFLDLFIDYHFDGLNLSTRKFLNL